MIIMAFFSVNTMVCAQPASDYESPPTFQATEFISQVLLTGKDYQIHPSVFNDGFQNRYELTTSFGPLTVEGKDLLKIRLQEIQAIRLMETLKGTEVYGTAMKHPAAS